MLKIEWDQQKNVVSVGKAEFTSYISFKNSASWAGYILSQNGMHEQVYNTKQRNKEIADMLGCSRSVLYKHFNKLQAKAFIAPIYDVLKKVSKYQGGQRWDGNIIRKVNESKDILLQTYEDKLYNILPIIALTGKSPKELKQEYKGVWKIISKNSLNKNKALVKAGSKYHANISSLAHLPTTILEKFSNNNAVVMEYIANNFKGQWNKPLANETRIAKDAVYLAEQLGVTVDPKWTPRRMKEEHDKMSQNITAKKYSKDVFDSVKDVSIKAFEHEGYVATLLDNAFAIAEEGNAMGHCVAGYSGSVARGAYLVYSVMKDGERSSTIGINRRAISLAKKEYGQWYLEQQYGKYNTSVKDEEERKLAEIIVGMLNKEK